MSEQPSARAPEPPPGEGAETPAPFARLRRVRRGGYVVRADTPAEGLFFVRSGRVRVFLLAASGHETTNAILGPGEVFGVAPLLGFPAYRVFAEALTDAQVWALPVSRLLQARPEDAPVLNRIVLALARRLTAAEVTLRDVALRPVAERIQGALARLEAGSAGAGTRPTHEHLAALVGARRETVSRAIRLRRAAGPPPGAAGRPGGTAPDGLGPPGAAFAMAPDPLADGRAHPVRLREELEAFQAYLAQLGEERQRATRPPDGPAAVTASERARAEHVRRHAVRMSWEVQRLGREFQRLLAAGEALARECRAPEAAPHPGDAL